MRAKFSASRKRFLKNKFEDEMLFLKHRFARLSMLIKKLKAILFEQHTNLEQIKKQTTENQITLLKIEELGKVLAKHQNQASDILGSLNKYRELYSIVESTIEKESLHWWF